MKKSSMKWKFIARDFDLNSDADWEYNVVPEMTEHDHCYPLYGKKNDEGLISWMIIFGN